MKTDELTENETRRAWDDFDVEEKPGFFRRHCVLTSVIGAAALGALVWFWSDLFPTKKSGPMRKENVVLVNVPPPPPPPPPPVAPPPPPPVEEKMIEQTPVENEPKPEPANDEPPPADLGTGIRGDGPPDGFGLTGRGGGRVGGTGSSSTQQRS